MKNKGVIEVRVGTLVVIVLIMAVLVLGIFLIQKIIDGPHFKIYTNESGELVEVDEMIVCCINVSNSYDNGGTLFCLSEENVEPLNISCGPLNKEDLTMEWLERNIDGLVGNYYKFGNYTIVGGIK